MKWKKWLAEAEGKIKKDNARSMKQRVLWTKYSNTQHVIAFNVKEINYKFR